MLARPLALAAALLAVPLAAAAAEEDPLLARGEAVAQRFCQSCHPLQSARGRVGLRERLRPEVWPDAEQAYRNVGQLWRVNGAMTFAFEGPDDERRALAAYLAALAAGNRVPPWKEALRALPLLACVAAATLWARRAARRARAGG